MGTPLILCVTFLMVFLSLRVFCVRTEATREIFRELVIVSIPFMAGVYVGVSGLDLMTDELMVQTLPLLEFSLGFQGLYWGLFFGFRDIRYFDVNIKRFAALHSFFMFTGILAASYILLYLAHFPAWEILIGGIYLTLALTQISSASLLFLKKFRKHSSSFAFLFKTVSGLSGLFTIILFGILSPMGISTSMPHFVLNLLAQVLIALVTGSLVYMGIKKVNQGEGILIWLLSLLLINSGMSYFFGFNPLLINLVSGMVISSGGFRKQQIQDTLKPLVRPVILFLLFYTGLSLKLHPWLTPAIVPGLILLRFILNRWSFRRFFTKQVMQVEEIRPILTSLIPLGVLTPAIAVHLHLISSSVYSGIISGGLGLAYIAGYALMILLIQWEVHR
ncbi:MAG: Sodium/hydrogen exchanger [Marinimicrobia bacterium 46_47]|nr:MAG: Sodium/hydrogen exchanger [Marinimicrobia bacterium 46_47]